VFQQENYTLNFIQAIMTAINAQNKTIVVGGDGRYYSQEAIEIICKVAAGNKVKKLIIGQNGILSTPAASHLIRSRGADGGILLTASHNAGGPENDFGIKYNAKNGGPANEALTDLIYAISKDLKECSVADLAPVNISEIGVVEFGGFSVEVINSVDDYVDLMKTIFDFEAIKTFLKTEKFKVLFDAMHGGNFFF
jgi:phosphoglucomutase